MFGAGTQANGAAIKGGTWFETGAEMLNGGTLNYFAVPWGIINNPLPLALVTLIEVGLMAAVERYRSTGEGPAGYSPGVGKFDSSIFNGLDPLYPGACLSSLLPALLLLLSVSGKCVSGTFSDPALHACLEFFGIFNRC